MKRSPLTRAITGLNQLAPDDAGASRKLTTSNGSDGGLGM
jgi:hypothetical protein